MGAWLDYVTFDVMGDLAFSKSFGLLNDGELSPGGTEISQGQEANAL
jgi:hypothetical protein